MWRDSVHEVADLDNLDLLRNDKAMVPASYRRSRLQDERRHGSALSSGEFGVLGSLCSMLRDTARRICQSQRVRPTGESVNRQCRRSSLRRVQSTQLRVEVRWVSLSCATYAQVSNWQGEMVDRKTELPVLRSVGESVEAPKAGAL